MALHWRPVGPEPSSVYWQRRAAVLVAALLLLVLPLWSLGGDDEPDTLGQEPPLGSAAPSSAASPAASDPASAQPSAAPAPEATPSPPPTPMPPLASCAPDVLEIGARAEQDSYRLGATPRLSLEVVNTGPAPCTRDLGQPAVELVVSSGPDRIWSSDDCAPGGAARVVTLQPGQAVVQWVTWNGRRSRPGCPESTEQAQPGTYRVSARVGELRREGDVFRLTG
jgi:hypothetical protein